MTMRTDKYILDAHGDPQPCDDVYEWGRWFEKASKDRSRIIAQDKDEAGGVDIMVSTVFLGLDHNFGASGSPVLWETLVMGGPLDQEMNRYTSREAALAGHQVICRAVRAAIEASPK